ncbi:MAG TPA: hypothetical protein VFL42_07000 [Terriglobales bacterium]|nr:hypothetical protein [Terriglobales bacterium]
MRNNSRVPAWVSTGVLALAVFQFLPIVHAQAVAGNDPAPTPGFTGVSFTVESSLVPPGGMFQFQLMLTEPKPISNSSSRPTLPTSTSGPVRGIALNDPIGQTAGVAVIGDAGIQITTTSPLASFGTNPDLDYPIVAIAMPIRSDAVVGSQFPLSIDLENSFWLDALGQAYPQEIRPGKLTIGGTINISDVAPGGGLQAAGATISVFGMGFTPDTRVAMEGINLTTQDYRVISANQIDVVLPEGLLLDGVRVRVKNQSGERAEYFSYLRTQSLGVSENALVNQMYPLFARRTYSSATLAWTSGENTFTALAIQNPGSTSVEVNLELRSATNQVLGNAGFTVPPMSRITRDLADFFPQAPAGVASVHVSSTQAVQLLGILGDAVAGTAVPVMASVP